MFLKKSVRASYGKLFFNLEYCYSSAYFFDRLVLIIMTFRSLFKWVIIKRDNRYILINRIFNNNIIRKIWENGINNKSDYIQERSLLNYIVAVLFFPVMVILFNLFMVFINIYFRSDAILSLGYIMFLFMIVLTITSVILNMLDNRYDRFCFLSAIYDYPKFVNEIVYLFFQDKSLFNLRLKKYFPLNYEDILSLYKELQNNY